MSSRGQPRAFAAAIGEARSRAQPLTLLAAAQGAWKTTVGERIAAQARPVGERAAILTVECRTAVWAQELDLLGESILERLNRALAPGRVEALRFRVGEASAD